MKGALWTLNIFGESSGKQIDLSPHTPSNSQVHCRRLADLSPFDPSVSDGVCADQTMATEFIEKLFGCQHNEKVWSNTVSLLNGSE